MNIITQKGSPQRKKVQCTLCASSLRPGLLWLGGADYLTCPDCEGTQWVTMYEHQTNKPPSGIVLVQEGKV